MCVSVLDIVLMIALMTAGPSFLLIGSLVKVGARLPNKQFVTVQEFVRWRSRDLAGTVLLGIGAVWSLGIWLMMGGPSVSIIGL